MQEKSTPEKEKVAEKSHGSTSVQKIRFLQGSGSFPELFPWNETIRTVFSASSLKKLLTKHRKTGSASNDFQDEKSIKDPIFPENGRKKTHPAVSELTGVRRWANQRPDGFFAYLIKATYFS